MAAKPTPHNFLLNLRSLAPRWARLLDHALSIGRKGSELELLLPSGSPTADIVREDTGDLAELVTEYFGPQTSVRIVIRESAAPELPLTIRTTKEWNHVVFILPVGGGLATVAVRKTVFEQAAGAWRENSSFEELARLVEEGDGMWRLFPTPVDTLSERLKAVPALAEEFCRLARDKRSYCQLLLPFPGDMEADLLEGRWYAAKDWGTSEVPGPIMQKYLGRIHYEYRPEGHPGFGLAAVLCSSISRSAV